MCLNYNKKATKRLLKRFDQNGGKLHLYKVYIKSHEGELWPPIIGDPIPNYGNVISNRPTNALPPEKELDVVDNGIHVFTNKKVVDNNYYTHEGCYVCLRVLVYKKYLIAAGERGDAVFWRVNIPKSEWKRIFKKIKGEKL